MTSVSLTEARAHLYKLIDQASVNHKPVVITGKRGNAVLLSEDDWNAINKILHLLSIPGMRDSIVEGTKIMLTLSEWPTLSYAYALTMLNKPLNLNHRDEPQ